MASRRAAAAVGGPGRGRRDSDPIRRQARELFGLCDGAAVDGAVALSAAAVEAFAEQGYHATTTRDIATRVGLSPAAVYVHYKTKEELLFTIMLAGHERILAAAQEAVAAQSGHQDRLRACVRSLTYWHGEQYALARVVQDELDSLSGEHFERIAAIRSEIEGLVAGLIADGVAAGAFDAEDVSATALAILSLAIDVARWFPRSNGRTPGQIADLYGTLALRMVQALPRRRRSATTK